jgi:uncharacterized protein YjiS (DUF1127 family)
MDARLTERELARLLPPTRFRDAEERQAILHAAMAARDAAIAEGLRRALRTVTGAVAALARAVAAWPSKRRTQAELLQLTDRELADIGLTRGDIGHVFDADFAKPVRAEKAPVALASRRALAA